MSAELALAPQAESLDELDARLVARHQAGDPDAFAELYRRHAAATYRRLSRILGPVPERDDLLQEVFLALHRALPRFRGDAAVATLIHRIAINIAYEHLRRARRRPPPSLDDACFDDLIAPTASPEAQATTRQDLARVFACVARIKPKKRIALMLRLVDGMSFDEIAGLVSASPQAVAKRVQHGQRELDEMLARTDRASERRGA